MYAQRGFERAYQAGDARGGTVLALVQNFYAVERQANWSSDSPKGFVVQPKRWIVERTHAWISRDRALAKDDERAGESAEALSQVRVIRRMARRLAT